MISGAREEKDKEWIHRRQMRLVQVRKQSNDIAKQLRDRVNNEERERKIKKGNEVGAKLEIWKVKQLKDLEEMYRIAVNDIGTAHKLAIQEPESNITTVEKQKVNLCKAKERGETAMEHALREKREAIEKKLIPIQRKIITRQIEDLRSSLVRSIPPHKQSVSRNISCKKAFNPKLFESSYEDEKLFFRKISCQEDRSEKPEKKTIMSSSEYHIRNGQFSPGKQKPGNKITKKPKRRPDSPYKTKAESDLNSVKSSNVSFPEAEKFWINLGEIEAITEVEEDEIEKKREEEEVEEELKKAGGSECPKKKESKGKSLKNSGLKKKSLSEKEGEHNIECYGYSVRHKCKLKNDVSSVRRVVNEAEPDPTELARQEQEQLEQEKSEKESKMMMAVQRGHKAIEKEKINRNYNELLSKLEKLSTKEKLIKTYCHIPPPHMFMSDERRQEKSVRRQRIMDSKFEKIYYETMGINPESGIGMEMNAGERVHETQYNEENHENHGTELNLGEVEWNLKGNSPESFSSGGCERKKRHSKRGSSPVEKVSIRKTPSSLYFKRTKISKGGEIFLSDIDRLLKKTRKLRQDSHRSSEHLPSECKLVAAVSDRHLEKAEEKENMQVTEVSYPSFVSGSSELGKSVSLSPCEGPHIFDVPIVTKKAGLREVSESKKGSPMDLGMGDLGRDFSGIRTNTIAWPVHQITPNPRASDETCARSSTTSYRGLPSRILPKRINSLLKLLVQLKEREGRSLVADELIVKMEETLDSLIREAERSTVTLDGEDCNEFQFNPQLNYYITKLLTMSRERIADLSVSSESDLSMQRMEEGGSCGSAGKVKPKVVAENQYLKQMNKSSKCSNLKRAKELERIVKKWKRILEQNLKKCPPVGENCEDSPLLPEDPQSFMDEITPQQNSSFFEKYEEVSKKCSACISGLSKVLAGFRKEVARGGECSEDENGGCGGNDSNHLPRHHCERIPKQECSRAASLRKPEAMSSCERTCPRRSTASNDDSRQGSASRQSADESLESLPDVMEALLKKGVISSPFHWGTPESEGSHCSEFCEFCGKERTKPGSLSFICRPTCRGACSFNFMGKSAAEAEKNEAAPVDAETLRALRKKLEKIPMKYVDSRYGVYSPTPVPRPISISPKDPEFIKRNFRQPLFGAPMNPPDPQCRRTRQLYFNVARDERPSSEPRSYDRNDMSVSESERQCSAGGTQKRPRSSPSNNRSSHDNIGENVVILNDATYVKDANYVSDEVCYSPNPVVGGGLNTGGGGTFIVNHHSVEEGICRREEDSQSRWSSGNTYADINEGIARKRRGGSYPSLPFTIDTYPGNCFVIPEAGSSRGELRTWIKSLSGSCAGSCAVHCNGNNSGSMACGRQASSGGVKSPARMTGSITEFPAYSDNRYSSSGRAEGGCPHQGATYDGEDGFGNAEGRLNLDWAEDFLEGLCGNDCYTSSSVDK